jgi:glutamate N-acetyltransferase/amino-acid N-acetyltransferase
MPAIHCCLREGSLCRLVGKLVVPAKGVRTYLTTASLKVPRGFLFAAATAGIKLSGAPDLGLATAPAGASAAALFTTNRVVAAPVITGRANLAATRGRLRAVLVNSGNANCATGKKGLQAANLSCRHVADALNCRPEEVFPSSTGVIGVPLPVERILQALPQLADSRGDSPEHVCSFARAIMTTDTRIKTASASFRAGKAEIRFLGVAKGAGMIHPKLATMLVYLFTDAKATPTQLRPLLAEACRASFNRISIDGDTSTNDTVLLLASGGSGAGISAPAERKRFASALTEICQSLARQIVADGEGVQHIVALKIEQAASESEAEQVARTIANSPLVKTAWAGADPNWGRVLAAVGYSSAPIKPERVSIFFGPHQVCRNGEKAAFDEKQVHEYLMQPELEIRVRLGRGRATATFWTCDLTTEYVKINAEYRT